MSSTAGDQWAFVFQALPDSVPAANRVRTLLKIAGRRLRLKCVRVSEQGEIERLQGIISSLAARVAEQSELLSRRAEKKEGP